MLKAYYPVFYLTSFEYDRTKQKLRGIAKSLNKNYQFYEWNCVNGLCRRDLSDGKITPIPDKEDPEELLKYILSQSEKDDAEIYILEDFHDFIAERNNKILLRQLAERLRFFRKHIIIVSSVLNLPVELEKYITVVELELPGRTDLEQVLLNVTKSSKAVIDDDLKKKLIDAALGMTVMEADLAFCLAAVKNNFDVNSPRTVALEKEQIIKKSGLLDYFQVNEELRNIGGMDFLKSWLEKRKQAYDFKAQLWQLPEPKGLLLLGVPGCGKSLTAKCIASLWNMPLLRLDIGKVFQGIVGSSEDNIRRAIATAEAVAPCVLWIDEIEKGLSGTQSSGATDGGTTARIFSTILTWMQEKTQPVFVVATANDISLLPPELLRKGRFDEIFFVDLPNEEDRKSIFSIHLAKKNQKPENFGLDKLAKESVGFNGAEIEECVKEAMFAAYTENPDEPKLQIIHLLNAIKDTVPLSKTMKDQIDFLRKWAKSRAKQAGKENIETISIGENVPLTKTEKELNRSFD
ncbi:MAG: AAA family ATPase [Bacteroidales bacterium]|nr:AAA family ATPase [Bacteroidales bacterium]